MKAWSVDWLSGHCYHSSGFTAYVDSKPTESNAMRCMGPFGPVNSTVPQILKLAETLAQQIELEKADCDSYVIWGAYREQTDFEPYNFPLLGSSSGFIPSLSLRSMAENSNWYRQWTRFESGALHQSGLAIYDSGQIEPPRDISVTHPLTLQVELRNSRLALEKIGLIKGSKTDRFEMEAIQLDSYIQTQLFDLAA